MSDLVDSGPATNLFITPLVNELRKYIKASVLAYLLRCRNIIEDSVYKFIMSGEGDDEKNGRLLIWLVDQGRPELDAFLQVLLETNCLQAYRIIEARIGDDTEIAQQALDKLHIDILSGATGASFSTYSPIPASRCVRVSAKEFDTSPKRALHCQNESGIFNRCEANDSSLINQGRILTETIGTESGDNTHDLKRVKVVIKGSVIQNVRRAEQIISGPSIHKMTAIPRGYCLIVNIVNFNSESKDARVSAVKDGEYLIRIFRQLGFRVEYYEDLKSVDILNVFEKYSKDSALCDHGCFVGMLMSHGEDKDLILGADSHFVKIEEILIKYNNYNCPALIRKPKVFFIQACRGHTTTDAAAFTSPHSTNDLHVLPAWSDMMIVYSSLQGYVSLRDKVTGSWFVDALGRSLIEHSWQYDLEEILKRVNKLMVRRESNDYTKQGLEVILLTWTKQLYFNPGLHATDSDEF